MTLQQNSEMAAGEPFKKGNKEENHSWDFENCI